MPKRFLIALIPVLGLLLLALLPETEPSHEERPAEPTGRFLPASRRQPLSSSSLSGTGIRREALSRDRGTGPETSILILTVTQGTGVPIPGVEVFLVNEGTSLALGRSGKTGRLEARIPDGTQKLDLAARAPRYVSLRESFPRPAGEKDSIVLHLVPGRSLEGRVVWKADGKPVGPGFRVLAQKDGVWPDLSEARLAFLGERGIPVAKTDEAGAFHLDGLPPERVRVWAGGEGGAVFYGGVRIPPGTSHVDVPVLPMVGAVIRIFPQGGGPFRTSPSLRSLSYGFSDSMDEEPEDLSRIGEVLAGVDPSWMKPNQGPSKGYLVVSSRAGDGPVLMDLFPYVPGYQGGRKTVELLPMGETVVHYDIELKPEAGGWSTLEIFFEGLPEGEILSQAAFGGVGRFFLREVNGTRHYEIRFPEAREKKLQLPQGRFQWHFLSTENYFRWPPAPGPVTETLTIGNDPEWISIDLSGLGGVECRAFRSSRPYRDALIIRIHPAGKPTNDHVSRFSHAPYAFSLLPSGFYELKPLDPSGETVTVFVSPGRFHAPASLILRPEDLAGPGSGRNGDSLPEEILKKLPKEIVEKLKAGGP